MTQEDDVEDEESDSGPTLSGPQTYVGAIPCQCLEDVRAMRRWQKYGGLMPSKTCKILHLKRCKTCKKGWPEINEDDRCDKCWGERERRLRPMNKTAAAKVEEPT